MNFCRNAICHSDQAIKCKKFLRVVANGKSMEIAFLQKFKTFYEYFIARWEDAYGMIYKKYRHVNIHCIERRGYWERAQKLSNKPFNEYILVMSWELVFLDNSYSRKRYWEQCENVLTLFLLFFVFNYEILSILKIFEKCHLALFSPVISLGLISLAISLGLKRRLVILWEDKCAYKRINAALQRSVANPSEAL